MASHMCDDTGQLYALYQAPCYYIGDYRMVYMYR